ncbi:MAG: formimidoylglutamate deiminase [Anaerolineae bacterium]
MIKLSKDTITIPGLASVHSHAFQRAMRGRTQRKALKAASFWSWRGLMYDLVEKLDPENMYTIAKLAYTEMALSGVTLVGEFHYVHHQNGGVPYANRTELADAVIRAATDVGIRICLIRTAYMRGGYQQEATAGQLRFIDPSVDLILQDVESLQAKYADHPLVNIGLAAHSIRTVPIEANKELANYASQHNLPFHMHVCEQRRELEESVSEHGVTPIELLANHGILNERFVGVHATHLSQNEIQLLGKANAFVNLCRTTERDLGDGLPQVSEMVAAGVRLNVGIDSHCCENAFEEIRAVENDERSRLEQRTVVGNADFLLDMGTRQGYAAVGLENVWEQDSVTINRNHIAVLGMPDETLVDGIIFNGVPSMVERVEVGGRVVVDDGQITDAPKTIKTYKDVVQKLI